MRGRHVLELSRNAIVHSITVAERFATPYAQSRESVWICQRQEIARQWMAAFQYEPAE